GEPAELHVVSPDDTESSSAEEVGSLLVRLAREGKAVVRLLAGDPFAFGRGALEAQALAESGVAFTVVPGIPEAIAAPARAGIPLTSEGLSSSVTMVDDSVVDGTRTDWKAVAAAGGTMVLRGRAGSLSGRLQ